ncbi:hypothetical protein KAR91_55995 [Candidatus Pacearchaeota archaeon]|nr:hypothetical protein [Candidatus Pacearchaeota archaeon]
MALFTKKNKQFEAFEREFRAIERMKQLVRGDKHYDAQGIPTKDKLLGLDQLKKFAHGRTKKPLKLFAFGQERSYQKRTIKAYRKRLENLIKRTIGGKTVKELLSGMSRKKSKSKNSPIAGTSRKQRIKTISTVQYVKMLGNIAYFRVSSSGDSQGTPGYYQFQVEFHEWISARALYSGVRGVNKAIHGPVSIHCSCKDFQFNYGFVAYHGRFGIESEQSYPKIKNPKLENTMCKHGGRVGEALLKGEFGLGVALANAMKSQAKKKENIDKELLAKFEKPSAKDKKETKESLRNARRIEKQIKEIEKSQKALTKMEKTKEFKQFTKEIKDKIFDVLPKVMKKAMASKKTVPEIVQKLAKKEKIDPEKAMGFAQRGIQKIMDRYKKAAVKAEKTVKDKAVQASLKKGEKIAEKSKEMRADLLSAQAFKDNPDLYEMTMEHLSKKYGKSVAELKKMT